MKKVLIIILFFSLGKITYSQNLLSLLDSVDNSSPTPEYINTSFKSVRLINGYTSDIAGKNDLVFSISHRFWPLNQGVYDLFGLDESKIRFGFEYGLNDRISLGLGRSSFEKLYDGFIKFKIAKQSANGGFPVSITLLEGMSVKTLKWSDLERNYPFSARLFYVHELLISRKISKSLSAQICPVLIHRNMVVSKEEQNLVPAVGAGLNYTIKRRVSVSAEYYYLLPGFTADNYTNSLALGVELESGGGHIFQIHLSNSYGMTEKAFIPESTGKWSKGDIGIGFNIIRVFHLKKNKMPYE